MRQRRRWVGELGPGLLFGGLVAGAVVLAWRVFVSPAGQQRTVGYITFLLGLFTFLLGRWGWVRARRAARLASSTSAQVEAAAERLAEQMFATWSQQVVQRGIETPAPVRVRWAWAASRSRCRVRSCGPRQDWVRTPRRCPGSGRRPRGRGRC